MTPIETLLAEIRAVAKDEHDKGTRFERLMLHAFKADRTFAQQFRQIWLWMDWPGRSGADIGVDLVAVDADDRLVAIQCKCYSPDTTLTKEEIDSFVALSGQQHWARRIIVATTDLWSANALKSLEGHAVPIERIGLDDLDAMTIDWSSYDLANPSGLKAKGRYALKTHQQKAVDEVRKGFATSSRGKLIMACGTGKTFTALKIAEEHAGAGKSVLFLAPSIALVAQSLKEWTAECEVPIRPYAVCSDATAGKPIEGENATPHDLVVPPTTDPQALIAAGVNQLPGDQMTVVFSTYQSIEVIAAMQTSTGFRFDLVVCDEAHRTAGVASVGDEDSVFALVHDDAVIPAAKRLYMTATPKLYKPVAIDAARESDAVVASMDDPTLFGEEFHRLGFGEAVEKGLLADYRVLILTVDEGAIKRPFQQLLSSNGELSLPDVARFVGCLSGLAKLPGAGDSAFPDGGTPMQRAVAFWSTIADSEKFAGQFEQVAESYFDHLEARSQGDDRLRLAVPTRHVDGTSKISSRRADIRWLKENPPDGECRVLTNARCLTEGVDVPALDAVMFLSPRRSKIDIVQAVGRVMRKPDGKDLGYVILPVAVTAGLDPAAALDQNRDYDAVWEVLQALRAIDERFNAYINRIALSSEKPGSGPDDPIKVISVDALDQTDPEDLQGKLFEYEEWSTAIYAKIVEKVGTKAYWEDWATDVALIAARHEARITAILDNSPVAAKAFADFLGELHATLNDGISRHDAVSMVSQHLITRPIFEALFGDDAFSVANPVSQAMSAIVAVLDEHSLETETEKLEDFYASVRRRVEGIHPDDGAARQRIIKDLYGRFFKIAFPRVAESLGIVYTPIEVVDFILRAADAALVEHFGAALSDEGVHVLDPFTGTGTFITRLIQSGYIRSADLERKFNSELHANELLLLAYYIAAINIETTYRQEHSRQVGCDPGYQPFPGVVLTDTFHLGEAGEGTGSWDVFPLNNERAKHQKGLDIRVILGNPPYSVGQESANDNNANLRYPSLDASITTTYAAKSTSKNKNKLYDSYLRAIRWASNRLVSSPQGGVVAFVTNSGYIDSGSLDGLRLSLVSEFDHLYIYNLRGNQRTAGEVSRAEGGKIFDSGSRAGVAIMVLVRLPGEQPAGGGVLHYRDIGEYLSRDQKLAIVADALPPHAAGLEHVGWTVLTPNSAGDWINQRTASFGTHLPMGADSKAPAMFRLRSLGLATGRDAWNYSSSRSKLDSNVSSMMRAYNKAADAFDAADNPPAKETLSDRAKRVQVAIKPDPQAFSWNRNAFTDVARGTRYGAEDRLSMRSAYRPFHPRWVEAGRRLNAMTYQLPKLFPTADAENLVITVPTIGTRSPFATLMVDALPDLHLWPDGTVCFPQVTYAAATPDDETSPALFDERTAGGVRSHNITGHALEAYRALDASITKDDVFFHAYGILHSPDYRTAFEADLKKSLPRIPLVPNADDFRAFADAGRKLSSLHIGFETVDPWPGLGFVHTASFDASHPEAYRVLKMKHPKVKSPTTGAKVEDRTRIIYNDWVTVTNIPERAYDYELGSRSAIGWLMDGWRVRADKPSKIVNDPNDWSAEQGDPAFILNLLGRVVAVSMRTLDVVDSLPPLDL